MLEGSAPGSCLTSGQLEVVKQIYSGMKLKNGEVYSHGFPPGHEGGATGWRQWMSGAEPPVRRADGPLAYTRQVPAVRLQPDGLQLQVPVARPG